MLGKLVHWLRILGQDVAYSTRLTDLDLILKAKNEDRILITKDFKLYQTSVKNKIKSFYVSSQNRAEVLAQIQKTFGLSLDMDPTISRCPLCNCVLKSVTKQYAAKKIKNNTLLYYDEYWSCAKCESIYWHGSHWKNIASTLEKAKNFV
ncbi:MAG: hypothetical protein AC479_05345 [miscellaneous Crenarchaeota group-6 archaeon AD8-1]|nr:MAG: hypothetical protein AC479_05345 [miscellaneous Crenarchaeota group-6 archaeon AD8-1]